MSIETVYLEIKGLDEVKRRIERAASSIGCQYSEGKAHLGK